MEIIIFIIILWLEIRSRKKDNWRDERPGYYQGHHGFWFKKED